MSILKREILYPGKTELGEVRPETKLLYHFETNIKYIKNPEPIRIDDSRRMSKDQPVETLCGKQFKLPLWESCLTSMRIGEICRLTVRDDPSTHSICLNYVATVKCFRKHYGLESTLDMGGSTNCDSSRHHHNESSHEHSSRCGSCLMTPYKDLNSMLQNPPEIFEFTFELVDVIPPESYTKDIWQMSDCEKRELLPKFREEGNTFYREGNHEAAAAAYSKGLVIIESLMLKEHPKGREWTQLSEMKTPFLLNLAQVKLLQREFYECIKHTDEVLKKDPGNIKALFRRAKAQAGVWNLEEARKDFKKCAEYDRDMINTVARNLEKLQSCEALKNKEDRLKFAGIFN